MRRLLVAAVVAGATISEPALARWPACGRVDTYPGEDWSLADPASRGWDAAQLERAHDIFKSQPSAAVVVVHRGRMIASWGTVAERYTAQSVRKALLNSLVGQLVDRGRLRVGGTLADLGIDDVSPPLTDSEKRATLRDLLMSRSGVFHTALYEVGGWKKARMALAEEERAAGRDLYPPGVYWIYNNWDFNVVGTIVEQAAKEEIGPLFANGIARPTGMQDFRAEDVEYTTSDHPAEIRFGNVSQHRAYVFNISTRDLARYGVLYLGCGRWGNEQVVSKSWVFDSLRGRDTREGRPADRMETGFGDYGYLWFIDRPGARYFPTLHTRDPFFLAAGARGHYMAVFPELDLVIVHQVATVGGVSAAAQQKRAREGSPEVPDEKVAALMEAIILAHPDAADAFGPN